MAPTSTNSVVPSGGMSSRYGLSRVQRARPDELPPLYQPHVGLVLMVDENRPSTLPAEQFADTNTDACHLVSDYRLKRVDQLILGYELRDGEVSTRFIKHLMDAWRDGFKYDFGEIVLAMNKASGEAVQQLFANAGMTYTTSLYVRRYD